MKSVCSKTLAFATGIAWLGCGDASLPAQPSADALRAPIQAATTYTNFSGPVFDITALPDGAILVSDGVAIKEIRGGRVSTVATVPTTSGALVNGLDAVGRRSLFATSGGPDLAMGAGLWRISNGRVALIGDIEAFETSFDPDAFGGPQWKHPACEEDPSQGFSAGPQSNPYHVAARSGSEALVADAAGNALLSGRNNGDLDWVAVLTPPVDANGDWRVLFTLPDGTDCYVQPVPTSVAIDADGTVYVGELTGAPAVPGWSRIWRIEAGAANVTCPSSACTEVISGLTSVIDLAFGPDGKLYVVEYDRNGWLAAILGNPAGGAILACDVGTGQCTTAHDNLTLPGAISFDKRGGLWLLENGTVAPSVRKLD